MAKSLLPRTDAEFLEFTQNFSTRITASAASYGLLPAQATDYAAKFLAFKNAYTAAVTPLTRTTPTILAKDSARTPLKTLTYNLVAIVRSFPSITPEQLSELGIPPKTARVPVPPPASSPVLTIVRVSGWSVLVRLKAADTTKRGKAAGAVGAALMTFVGDEAPADCSAYTFQGNVSRPLVDIVFPTTLAAGTKVWISAFWFNARMESSPACNAVGINLAGGGVLMGVGANSSTAKSQLLIAA